jgi:hypothetical protein
MTNDDSPIDNHTAFIMFFQKNPKCGISPFPNEVEMIFFGTGIPSLARIIPAQLLN